MRPNKQHRGHNSGNNQSLEGQKAAITLPQLLLPFKQSSSCAGIPAICPNWQRSQHASKGTHSSLCSYIVLLHKRGTYWVHGCPPLSLNGAPAAEVADTSLASIANACLFVSRTWSTVRSMRWANLAGSAVVMRPLHLHLQFGGSVFSTDSLLKAMFCPLTAVGCFTSGTPCCAAAPHLSQQSGHPAVSPHTAQQPRCISALAP
jgi:hypothetical protein